MTFKGAGLLAPCFLSFC